MNFIGFVVVALVCIWFWEKHPGVVLFGGALLGGTIIYLVITGRKEAQEYRQMLDRMTPEERAQHEKFRQDQINTATYGPINSNLVCPHCTTPGHVRSTLAARSTTAVSNTIAKVSATTKTQVTQRHCDKCQSTWDI